MKKKDEFITTVESYKKSANQKKAGAQFNIGRLYDKRYGKHNGITANDAIAKKWYWQAVNNTDDAKANGRKYALFNLFLILREEGKIEEGKKLLHRAVDEEIDLYDFIETLVKLGYQREEVCEEKNTFSVHGDIIDIFISNMFCFT